MELNFFAVGFPRRDLEFWTAARRHDEALAEDERLVAPSSQDQASERAVIYVGHSIEQPVGFSVARLDARELTPGVVHTHVRLGLTREFQERGYRVVPVQFGFRCFEPNAELSSDLAPSFLRVLRGVELHVDCIGVGHDRVYGCFVTPRALVEFRSGLEDAALAEAALEEQVNVEIDGIELGGRLIEVDAGSRHAHVERRENRMKLDLNRVRIPASPRIVSRYSQIRGTPPSELRRIYLAGQIANFRLSPQGGKNRRWLVRQYDYLRSWLLEVSNAGYVRFKWPRSTEELTLAVRPMEALENT